MHLVTNCLRLINIIYKYLMYKNMYGIYLYDDSIYLIKYNIFYKKEKKIIFI